MVSLTDAAIFGMIALAYGEMLISLVSNLFVPNRHVQQMSATTMFAGVVAVFLCVMLIGLVSILTDPTIPANHGSVRAFA